MTLTSSHGELSERKICARCASCRATDATRARERALASKDVRVAECVHVLQEDSSHPVVNSDADVVWKNDKKKSFLKIWADPSDKLAGRGWSRSLSRSM